MIIMMVTLCHPRAKTIFMASSRVKAKLRRKRRVDGVKLSSAAALHVRSFVYLLRKCIWQSATNPGNFERKWFELLYEANSKKVNGLKFEI